MSRRALAFLAVAGGSLLCLSGCAASADPVAVDPAFALTQPGDTALTCDAIGTQIVAMNKRITLAQQMTILEVNGRTRVDSVQGTAGSGGRTSNSSGIAGEPNYPAISDASSVAMTGGGAADDEVLAHQAEIAKAATARANQLIRLGRLKRCFQ